MKNDSKSNSKKFFVDKMFLILSAIVVGICLLIFMFYLNSFKFQEGWKIFILMSILYIFVFTYSVNKQIGLKRKMTNMISFLLFLFFALFPIIVGFILFYFYLLPFPKRNFTYLVIGIIFLPISVVSFEKSLKFFNRKEHS